MPEQNKAFEKFKKHFPNDIGKGVEDFAINIALLRSRYIFTRRAKGIQFGYCTHCQKEHITEGNLKHNQMTVCPKCQSNCKVKASGISRKYLCDASYFIYYEKSLLNPEVIIARGFFVARDYSQDFKNVQTRYDCCYMYLFEPGNSELYENSYLGYWKKRKSIISQFETSMAHECRYISYENVQEAVHGTPFQYSTWEQYFDKNFCSNDMVKFFDLASKYPCIEYLTKMGLKTVVEAKLFGSCTYRMINWRGKSITKVLKLTKQELKELRAVKFTVSPLTLNSYHFFKKNGVPLSFEHAHLMETLSSTRYYLNDLNRMLEYAPLKEIVKYFLKQFRRTDSSKYYHGGSTVLISWRDYIKECQELGMDLKQEHVLFPNNLQSAHQKTMKQVKIKADKALNQLIAVRVNELDKYTFEKDGLFIRPAKSLEELFHEGKALNHCVGRYTKDYANGFTDLLVLRKSAEEDKPFYTVEIIKGKISQVRGYKNHQPTKEVKEFIKAFEAAKLSKKKARAKVPA
ncbi:PcfJ domain-containing protein [Brevibacillus halotolerans]|nr:PcfJ domain-containing protein [Brevibacillus halotolerans]